MKVNELVNTCMNQYSNLFEINKNFKIILITPKEDIELGRDYTQSIEYLRTYREMKVNYWMMEDINTLKIGIE